MQGPIDALKKALTESLKEVFGIDIPSNELTLSDTKKEFEGTYTLVVFPFTKKIGKRPEIIAVALGEWLKENRCDIIADYNVIKGFLNLSLPNNYWIETLEFLSLQENFGIKVGDRSKVMVEFSSPNTNKPLHLGHIRNILLGWSTSRILEAVGHPVVKTQIINDRGIAICKSMVAWQLYGEGATPSTTETKGDHMVGEYYIRFEKEFKAEYHKWQDTKEGLQIFTEQKKEKETSEQFYKRYKNQYFNLQSSIAKKAKAMLLKWEDDDPTIKTLWSQMNGWVYEGFNTTYKNLGVSFDELYYESNTYLLGKNIVNQGLASETFYSLEDGSVWVDLEEVGLDKKILLRSDGTSVYMTQDIGTAQMRYEELATSSMIYVVADEQDYHFQALFEILKKLKEPYAEGLYHLSYGMVDLPSGKMKSREGTVVDADDLIAEVINEVREAAQERGEIDDFTKDEKDNIYRQIGLAALKFFILKVNPKKRMIFDPKESVDMQGQTGPYIQNAFVRIKSIRRKLNEELIADYKAYEKLDDSEKELLRSLATYSEIIQIAARNYDPSTVANYAYDLAKKFHRFYHDVRILTATTKEAKSFRMHLSAQVAKVLEHAMFLLGIEMPERM